MSIHLHLCTMCFGPLRRLCHWGPWVALFLIFYITAVAVYCDLVMWPPTTSSYLSIINFVILSQWIFLILYNYFYAVFEGPGFVPKGWRPVSQGFLFYCIFLRLRMNQSKPTCIKMIFFFKGGMFIK